MAKQNRPQGVRSQNTRANAQSAAARQAAAKRSMAQLNGQRAAQRKRLWTIITPIVVIIAVVGVLVAVKAGSGGNKVKSGVAATGATATVISEVTSVPETTLNTVGKGSISTPPTKLTGPALTSGDLPRVLFVGAEWCPYCAAERWALAVALSRFGTLSGLGEVRSSSTDVYPSTATVDFHGATYTSKYLSLTAKEIYSNQALSSGTGYQSLDTLDSADMTLFENVGQGSFPFIDIGGKYLISGASYDPGLLKGLDQAQIAADLKDPNSSVAKGVDGTANVITAAFCKLTNGAPSNVCTSAGVTAAAASLPS